MISRKKASKIGLLLGPVLFVFFIIIPIGELEQQLSFEARIVLATTVWMAVWWITEAIPIYVTAMLPLIIFPSLSITDIRETSASYADRIIFLFLGGFERFVTCLVLSVAYSASIGGVTTLIGTPPNAIFASLANSITGTDVTFAQWLLMGLPISGISLLVAWLYMIRFGSKITDIKLDIIGGRNVITKKLSELGQLSRDEKVVTAVFIITAAAWISRGLIWKDIFPMIDDSTIAIASAISLFILPSTFSKHKVKDGNSKDEENATKRNKDNQSANNNNNNISKILDWDTAVRIPWGVLILIGGGLALASAFTSTGLGDWIAEKISFLGNTNYILIILVFVTLAILPTEMISNTATAALLIPIAASFASSMDLNPILFMAPVAIATSYGFIMPVGTPPNAIVYSSGFVTAGKMARAGLPLDFISIVMVTILTSILVPLVFGI